MRGFRKIGKNTLRPARKRSRGRKTATSGRGNRLSIEQLEPRVMLDGSAVITEFMAINYETLEDVDGEFSDWIEIHNPTGSPFDLDGWYLTDDARHRAKWRFPDYTMATDEHLIVFASGKNRTNPAGELHTSFQLSGSGDYLALVRSDGATIVSEFGPGGEDYPRQFDDVSYGITDGSAAISLVGEATTANVLVPSGDALGTTWTEAGFTPDASWTTGPLGVGYEPGGAMLRLDFNARTAGESGAANTEDGFDTFTLSQNGATYNGIKVTVTVSGGASADDRDRSTPVDSPPGFTFDQIYDDFIFANGTFDGATMEVLVEGLAPDVDYPVKLWSFDSSSGGGRVSDWTEIGGTVPVTIENNYTFDGNNLPTGNDDDTMTAMLTSSATGKLKIRGVRNGGTSHGVFLNAMEIGTPGISDLIRTDIGPEMRGENASAFVRTEFIVPAGVTYEQLTLRMNYDAGFVAYLNGAEVARSNAPGSPGTPPAFDASATQERTFEQTLASETFDLTPHLNRVIAGATNVLAVHGLNSSASEADFLILPELTAVDLEGSGLRYFVPATPAASNHAGLLGFVADTTFSVDRGFYDAPLTVAVTTATPGATIIYTTDGSEPSPTNGVQAPAATAAALPVASVPVDTTTYLRAIAIKQGYLASNVDTQTYIFLDDVIAQNPTPGVDYPATWQSSSYSGDYQMDPQVVAQWDDDNPANTDYGIRESLRSLPTMSIVMDHEDLWGSSTGIYNHATARGSAWRERASIEYFDPATGEEFQVNAGVQMHGGASRDNARLKKHSFRLVFNEEFGSTTFNFPLFSDSDIDEINTIVLKCFFTDGFATRSVVNRYNPIDSQYLRDTWISDSMLAMGNPDTHAEYVHLYINGLYWGLYSPLERPDDAFMAEYLGGVAEDYDVIKDFNELFRGSKTAWNAMFALANAGLSSDAAYQRIQGNNADGTPNAAYPNYLDVDNLIDFMILHLYSGAEDWPHHNWYAARDRVGETDGFQFFTWDQEIVLDDLYRDRTEVSNDMTPARLYSKLRANAEFRMRFADRVHKHLFNDGALAVEPAQARWMDRADQIEMGMIAESARWGDAREGQRIQIRSGVYVTVPTLTVDHWRTERDKVRDVYIPGAHWRTVDRFQNDNLYTTTVPPTLNRHGGEIDGQFDVAMTAPAGTIYYTTDGTDPRLTGGGVNGGATIYGGAFRLPDSAIVKARVRSGAQWSALTEATFLVGRPPLVITELNYHPHDPTPAELATQDPLELPFDQDDFEFIELTNTGTTAVDLTGVHFSGDVTYQFPDGATLAPDAYAVLVRNPAAFSVRYPGVAVAGMYVGALGNGGDEVQLRGRFDQLIVGFTYNDVDEWPGRCDGKGATLELIDPAGVPKAPPHRTAHLNDGENWHSSVAYGGTPGSDPAPDQGIVINEVLSHTDWPQVDSIELHNTGDDPVDVGGWYLSDSWGWDPLVAEGGNDSYKKYRIPTDAPAETTIAPGGYLVFDERDFNPTPVDPAPRHFALNGDEGDDVWLMRADASGTLTHFGDHVEFGAQANGESWGRWPDAAGRMAPMTRFTPGGDNSTPRLGSVIISEIQYNPGAMAEAADLEFVEIYNTTSQPVDLINWRLRKAVSFDFADADVLGPHEAIVVVGFDPVAEPLKLAHFENTYNTPGSIEIRGPYNGKLDNDGERVQLQRPDEPPTDKPGFFPGLLEDEVVYDDRHGWPADADGRGASLDRRAAVAWGNLPTNWTAETPSPGVTEFATEVVGRYVVYNRSAWDGNDAAANDADDDAIATDKTALLPGQLATAANYTSYSRGINAVMIDLANLPDGVVLTAADFRFRIGNDDTPADWTEVTPDVVHVRTAVQRGNADSVTVVFGDNVVRNTWLEVTVVAAGLGLPSDDVFYFGNAVTETGNSTADARVTTADLLLTRNNPRDLIFSPAPVTFPYDFNRDKRVNATDVLLARNNQTNFLNALELIDLRGEAEQSLDSPAAALAWLSEFDQPATQRPAQKNDAVAAVDQLLATYWPAE